MLKEMSVKKKQTYLSRSESVDTFIQALFQTTVVLFNRLNLRDKVQGKKETGRCGK